MRKNFQLYWDPPVLEVRRGNFLAAKGKKLPKIVAQIYGARVPKKERPLNQYVEDFRCFQCPADKGGGAYMVPSCWHSFGNSYQAQTADDMFRIKHVLGERSEKKGSYESTPITLKEIKKSPKNKIIQGDWNWPYDKEDAWHSPDGKARHVMLFGDGHVELYLFPPTKTMTNWFLKPPPDLKFRWW